MFYTFYLETEVKGFSMQPTININMDDPTAKGDKIFINPYSEIAVNDIVVAKVDWYERHIIKRVIGCPGDKVEIRDLENTFGVYVNNNLLYEKEKYGTAEQFNYTGTIGYYAQYQNFLNNPEFANYVEQDGANKFIQLEENEYFLMGDNWGQTTDSVTKGVVKSGAFVGKVEIIIDVTNNNPFFITIQFLKIIFS